MRAARGSGNQGSPALKGLDYPLAQAYYTLHDGERKRRLSDDAIEGPRAFAEKRAPDWKGN